jgi:predicted ATP-grasp superfamily ATP-dependent carboligase
VLISNATSDAGLSAARSLARAGYEVSSADVVEMRRGLRSRFIGANYVLAKASPAAYAASLLDLVDRIRPDVLLPLGNQSTFASAAMRDRLSAMTALNVPDEQAIAVAQDKLSSIDSLETLGIACARRLSYEDAVDELAGNPELTVVVKPAANLGAAHGVRYVKTRGELDDAIAACRAAHGDALIQEFIAGGSEAMKTVILLYSRESSLVAAFTTVKKREWPTTGGLTVVSRSTRDDAIVEQVKPFFEHWKWKGPAEVEIKRDARIGVDKVIEINPRFPSYFRFADRCGLDFATLAVRIASGEDVRPLNYPAYRVGETYLNPGLLIKSTEWHLRRTGMAEVPRIISDFGAGFGCFVDMMRDPAPILGRIFKGSGPAL